MAEPEVEAGVSVAAQETQAPLPVRRGNGPNRFVRRWRPKVAEGWDLARDKEVTIEAELRSGKVDFNTVLILKRWASFPNDRTHRPLREMGARYYDRAFTAWKAAHADSRAVVFPVGGIYLLPDSTFRYTLLGTAIGFDWTDAERLLLRVDGLAEQAREWWPYRDSDAKSEERSGTAPDGDRPKLVKRIAAWPGNVRRRRRSKRRVAKAAKRRQRNDAQRQPHLDRAFYCVSSILNTIARENDMNHPLAQPGLRLRAYSLVTATFALVEPSLGQYNSLWPSQEPSGTFQAHLEVLRTEADRVEALLNVAATRTAQANYTRGMAIGTGILIVGSAAVATGLAILHVPAQYAISAPAGALGALVSVFQRMTTGTLYLDLRAGRRLLQLFGGIRPLIGAIFGMAVYAVLKGGVLPAVGAPTAPLAFYGAIGFLAGFNERFAQDMLGQSAEEVAVRAFGRSGSA